LNGEFRSSLGAFVAIAVETRERKVVHVVFAFVLTGNYVIDLGR